MIAAADDVAALKAQPTFGPDIKVYPDTEALRALEAIAQHRPSLIVLDRAFVDSSRGAAIINRIKTDPTLSSTQIRVVAQANDYLQLVSRRSKAGLSADSAVPGDPLPDDYRGTRVAARVRIDPDVEVRLDGEPTALIDLSGTGAQVRARVSLRPGQRVRLAITDAHATVKLVAWSPGHRSSRRAARRPRATALASRSWMPTASRSKPSAGGTASAEVFPPAARAAVRAVNRLTPAL